MENDKNEAFSELLSLLDEASALLSGDTMRERGDIFSYQLEDKADSTVNGKAFNAAKEVESCHLCPLFKGRRLYAEPTLKENSRILFIAPYPEGDTILSPASKDYFGKWCRAISLSFNEISLSTLLKCPSSSFNASNADICKTYLREEMAFVNPRLLVLLGSEVSSYMLRKNRDFNLLRQVRWNINGIPTICTYHPRELVADLSLRRPIWDDLKFIASELGIKL